jgi:hypothetical protein
MTTTLIKSCPFCANDGDSENLSIIECEEQVGDGTAIPHYYVECECCDSSGPVADDKQSAVDFWNHRIGETETTFTDLVLPTLLPKLRKGQKTGLLQLDGKDCDELLKVMQVSVTIETFIEHMASMCRNTLAGDQLSPKKINLGGRIVVEVPEKKNVDVD